MIVIFVQTVHSYEKLDYVKLSKQGNFRDQQFLDNVYIILKEAKTIGSPDVSKPSQRAA